jgi:type II secretory pathway component GspD/PulD (secretin)
VTRRLKAISCIVLLALAVGGCAAGRAFRQGNLAMRSGDVDQAVAYYRTAVQGDPDNAAYKIALERAMVAASRAHIERAQQYEAQGQLDAARSEYRLASEYDPSNQTAAAKVAALDQAIRARNEAARPPSPIESLRAQARAAAAPPVLNPVTDIVDLRFATNTNLRDLLTFLADQAGISIVYDRDAQNMIGSLATSADLRSVTVEEALRQLLTFNGLTYKVLSERAILIFQDTAPKHTQYDDQVVQTFYLSHADATELSQLISSVMRIPGMAIIPMIQANKTGNTLIVRGTRPVVEIIERLVAQNDKPRAEIVFDIEILEVDRNRVKNYGLNLSEYAVGTIFSPEVSPSSTTTQTPTNGTPTPGTPATTTTTTGRSTTPSAVASPPPFNLNTISQGISTADFYLAVPTAVVRFLESDTNTKIVAKPQLRGTEGAKLTLNLGSEVPVITTSYTPIATGGVGVNPLNSVQYRPVGINVDILPRFSLDGDILIEMTLESSTLGANVSIGGSDYPTFGSRRVTTKLRLRDGEANLLAGLLREDERRSLSGVPGAIRVPVLRQLFSNNDQTIQQTDIVMLLTPHIIRTPGITVDDLRPVFIGTQANIGLGGPPPIISLPGDQPALAGTAPAGTAPAGTAPSATSLRPGAAAAGAPPPGQAPQLQPGATLAPPPGATPVPGTVVVPPAPAPAAPVPPAPVTAPPDPAAPPPTAPPPGAAAAPAQPPAPEPVTSQGFGLAQVFLTPPPTFRLGGGPYTVPISISNVSRLSTVTLTITFDPSLVRVRSVLEGSFMRSGGANATFTQQISQGRVDVTIVRANDAVGATGTGLLTSLLIDALAPGSVTFTVSGAATGPGGTPMGLQFRPVAVNVQQ